MCPWAKCITIKAMNCDDTIQEISEICSILLRESLIANGYLLNAWLSLGAIKFLEATNLRCVLCRWHRFTCLQPVQDVSSRKPVTWRRVQRRLLWNCLLLEDMSACKRAMSLGDPADFAFWASRKSFWSARLWKASFYLASQCQKDWILYSWALSFAQIFFPWRLIWGSCKRSSPMFTNLELLDRIDSY